ncbi:glycosyltransferase family 4 protein [Desertivirga arenae]|uniref:glycosyltransferase family 4 protein n=1 Tax=Desertivirga arenae TaxID=2810309 RepID=UPI001A97BD48|nr:glycosyltransferase family 1 protein [Pedobacter sp. SYSU D00823]
MKKQVPQIFLDDIIFSLQRIGGISVCWEAFLRKWQQSRLENVSLIRREDSKSILSLEDTWKGKCIPDSNLPLTLARLLPLLVRLPAYSLFHSSYLRYSLRRNICNIITIHDLAAELGMVTGWRARFKRFLQQSAIRQADGIICVSETTRKALLHIYPKTNPKKIKTIYHGFSNQFYPLKQIGDFPGSKTILFVGGRAHYKNFEVCIKVIEKLRDFELLLIGGGPLSDSEKNILNRVGRARWKHNDLVSVDQLNEFYNLAYCLLYPSLYEGFGMPVIEAMKAGCPVVCAGNEALKEVAGDAALIVDRDSNHLSYIEAILSLDSKPVREAMIQKGLKKAGEYSINKNFEETVGFYKEVFRKKFGRELEA